MVLKQEAVEESVGHKFKQTDISVLSLLSDKEWKRRYGHKSPLSQNKIHNLMCVGTKNSVQ